MTKKKRSYTTLRKKLHELEAELQFYYSHPLPFLETGDDNQRHFYAEEIQQRFLFLNKLLKAEIGSASPSKPHRLLHRFAKKVTKLENSFQDRVLSSSSTTFPPVKNIDSVSTFSSDDNVVSSVRKDVVVAASGEESNDSNHGNYTDSVMDIALIQNGKEDETEMKLETICIKRGNSAFKICGVFVSGMVFGTVLTGMAMADFFPITSIAHHHLPVPT